MKAIQIFTLILEFSFQVFKVTDSDVSLNLSSATYILNFYSRRQSHIRIFEELISFANPIILVFD